MSLIKPKIKNWVLSRHAIQRANERRISVTELQQMIEEPDDVLPQGTKWIFAKKLRNRSDNLVAAVLIEKKELELWVVVTVMIHFEKVNAPR